MTIEALYTNLNAFAESLRTADVVDDALRELEIVITRLRIRLLTGIYDPQKPLPPDVRADLEDLLQKAEGRELAFQEQDRSRIVKAVVSNTRNVLSREGMPF